MIWVAVQKLWTFRSTNVRTSWSQSIIIMHLRQQKWVVSWRKEMQIVSSSLSCACVHGIHLWWVSFRRQDKHLPWHPEGLDSSSYNIYGETEREGEKNDCFISCQKIMSIPFNASTLKFQLIKGWFMQLHSSNMNHFAVKVGKRVIIQIYRSNFYSFSLLLIHETIHHFLTTIKITSKLHTPTYANFQVKIK